MVGTPSTSSIAKIRVGILIFENVEVLDFAGPTGALVLARIGLLRDKCATTHWGALDLLASIDPSIDVRREERVVRDGVVTSAGVAAGIDMALSVVEDLCGKAVADETARYVEYPRRAR